MEFSVDNLPKPPRPERIIELIGDHLDMKSNQRGGWIEVPMTRSEYELIVKSLTTKTRTITLCGSTRFFKLFDEVNYKLTMNNYIVLSIGCHSQSDYCLGIEEIESSKAILDQLHKEKIDLSHQILVLDKDGYIGNSTRSEIDHAVKTNKKIFYYSKGGLEELIKNSVGKK